LPITYTRPDPGLLHERDLLADAGADSVFTMPNMKFMGS
jgi:hypothetical protein